MTLTNSQEAVARLKSFLQPWYESIADPETAQKKVLGVLLEHYGRTDYGREHGAPQVETIEDYRRAFPVAGYENFKPLIQRISSFFNSATTRKGTAALSSPFR